MKQPMKHFALPLVALYLSGCAVTSVFSPYPNQAQEFRIAIDTAKEAEALKKLDDKRNNADKILYLMERGRVGQAAGLTDGSLTDFSAVLEAMDVNEDKAKLSVTDTGAQGATLLTNDNAIPYRGEAYERVFVHHYQALNYLGRRRRNPARQPVSGRSGGCAQRRNRQSRGAGAAKQCQCQPG
jgi:hypothetical protein